MRRIALFLLVVGLALPGLAGHDMDVLGECDKFRAPQNRSGVLCYRKFGHNPDVDTGTDPEEVWNGPTATYNWPPDDSTLRVSSDDADDTEELLIQGLDEDRHLTEELVTLDGLTFVEVPGTWDRVYRATPTGSTELVGNVYIHTDDVDGDANGIPDTLSQTHGFIIAGQQGTEQTPFSTPADFDCAIVDVYPSATISVGGTRTMDVTVEMRELGGVFIEKTHMNLSTSSGVAPPPNWDFPIMLQPMTDISFLAVTDTDNAAIAVAYTIACVPDSTP